MSTHVRSSDGAVITLKIDGEGYVFVNASDADGVTVSQPDLFDAIRTELGAIVIDKAELPDMTAPKSPHAPAVAFREEALRCLAIVAHLEANPPKLPVVETLALLVNSHGVRGVDADRIARAIVTHFDVKDPS